MQMPAWRLETIPPLLAMDWSFQIGFANAHLDRP